MDATETALVLVLLATGVVAGFVVWTYVGPVIASSPTPTA
jgi:hypothetical protein